LLTDEELTRRALGLLPTLALWALRDARRPRRVEQSLARWSSVIRALAQADSGGEALMTLFRYLSLVVEDLSPQTLVAALTPARQEPKEKLMTTMAERWRAEGARHVLVQQLQLKFGDLPGPIRARVDAASESELLHWSERVLTAGALADVLAD
jgi:hypothetical protein